MAKTSYPEGYLNAKVNQERGKQEKPKTHEQPLVQTSEDGKPIYREEQ